MRAKHPVTVLFNQFFDLINNNTSFTNGRIEIYELSDVQHMTKCLTSTWQQGANTIQYNVTPDNNKQNDWYATGTTSGPVDGQAGGRNTKWGMRGFWQNKILYHGARETVTFSNQQNTYCDVDCWVLKPKKDIPYNLHDLNNDQNPWYEPYNPSNVLTNQNLRLQNLLKVAIVKMTDLPFANASGMTTFIDRVVTNVNWKPTDLMLLTQFYTITKHHKFRLNVGEEKQLSWGRMDKRGKIIGGPHLAATLVDKNFGRYMIVKTQGQLINNQSGDVGYSDVNLAIKRMQRSEFRQIDTTFKYLPVYPPNPDIGGDPFFVMNPVSGVCEQEIDTSSGPVVVQQAPNTGMAVYVTNGVLNRVPVVSLPGALNDNSELEESFKTL